MTMATLPEKWTPVLRDGVYCSPACGGGKGICDKSKYDLAVKKAKALAKRMGAGWKPNVWENMGWYYIVGKGTPVDHHFAFLEISPPRSQGDMYTAWVQTSPQFIESDKNPGIALSLAVAKFDNYLAELNKQRKAVGKIL
jgi:hypothetical protein